jgi:hypothetical protein
LLPEIYQRSKILVESSKELSPTVDRICSEYYNGILIKIRKKKGRKRKEKAENLH